MDKYQELQRYCSQIKEYLKADIIFIAVDYELDVGKDIDIACKGNPIDIFKLIVCVLKIMTDKEKELLKKYL